MLVGRVDFEMLMIGSSPLPDVSFSVFTAQPLLLRKSDADVFWEDHINFVTFQSPSAVYK